MNSNVKNPLNGYVARWVANSHERLLDLAHSLAYVERQLQATGSGLAKQLPNIQSVLSLLDSHPKEAAHHATRYAAAHAVEICKVADHIEDLIQQGKIQPDWLSGPSRIHIINLSSMSRAAAEAQRLAAGKGAHLPVMSNDPGTLTPVQKTAAQALKTHRQLLAEGDMEGLIKNLTGTLIPAYEQAFPYQGVNIDHLPSGWNGFMVTGTFDEETVTKDTLYATCINGQETLIAVMATVEDARLFSAAFNFIAAHPESLALDKTSDLAGQYSTPLEDDAFLDLEGRLETQPQIVRDALIAFGFDGNFYDVRCEGTDSSKLPVSEDSRFLTVEMALLEQRKFEHEYPNAFVISSLVTQDKPVGKDFVAALVALADNNQDLVAQALENKGVTGILQTFDGASFKRTFDDLREARAAALAAAPVQEEHRYSPRMG